LLIAACCSLLLGTGCAPAPLRAGERPNPPGTVRLAVATAPIATSSGTGWLLRIWLTGYSWQDNTPPDSAIVSHPQLHQLAGGTGTYLDPITVAVPGEGYGIWIPGSRFYLPTVRRYVIVEDTGASPPPPGQDGHLDLWIGGQGGTRQATDACEKAITGITVPAVYNPAPGYPVIPGPVFANNICNVPSPGPAAPAPQ